MLRRKVHWEFSNDARTTRGPSATDRFPVETLMTWLAIGEFYVETSLGLT